MNRQQVRLATAIVAITIGCCAVLLKADDKVSTDASAAATDNSKGGRLHQTLTHLNNAAEKVSNLVKNLNGKIEARVENIIEPQQQQQSGGILGNLLRGAGHLVGGVAKTVGHVAMSATKNTAAAVRASIDRLRGRSNNGANNGSSSTTTPSSAGATPSAEAASAPQELTKTVAEPTTATTSA